MITYLIALFCVFGLAVGQMLFKISSIRLAKTGSFFHLKVAASLLAAMFLYGLISVAWVWILQKVELGRIYPLMALAFVLVPLGSHFLFGERFTYQYFAGVTFIVIGIIIAAKN